MMTQLLAAGRVAWRAALVVMLLSSAFAWYRAAQLLDATRAAAVALPVMVETQIGTARQELVAEIQQVRIDLRDQVSGARRDIRQEIGAVRKDLFVRVDHFEDLIDSQATLLQRASLGEIRAARVDITSQLFPVTEEARQLLSAYRQVPAQVGRRLDPWTDCPGNGACWQAQFTAALGATRSTLGQVARAAPEVATSFERSAAATERATEATAKAMGNLAELSRPLPRWLRVPLQVVGPTAPLWVPFVGR